MKSSSLTTHLNGATSVLLVAPPSEPPDDHACMDLLTVDDPERENVLSVTFSQTPDDRVAVWQREVGEPLPNRAVVVDGSGSGAEDRRVATSDDLSGLSVDVLSETAGPMELALTVGQYLGEWADASEQTLACFHSLSDLLEAFAHGEVVQLLNALNARFETVDAVAHYHFDPSAHDERVLSEIRPLFDAVVEHVPENGLTVTSNADGDAPEFRGESSALYPDETAAASPPPPPLDRSIDAVLELLSDDRRRSALAAIADRPDPVSLEAIADEVYDREIDRGEVTGPLHRREVLLALAHNHLPKLDTEGLVEYDHDAKVIREGDLGPGLEAFVAYVDQFDRA